MFKNIHRVERTMVEASSVELLAEALCGISAVLFTFIATFSRSPRAEQAVQNVIFVCLLAAAAVLWWLPTLEDSSGARPTFLVRLPFFASFWRFLPG